MSPFQGSGFHGYIFFYNPNTPSGFAKHGNPEGMI
jgi:hypothetical protein